MNGWESVRVKARAYPYVLDALLAAFLFAASIAASQSDRGPGFVVTTPSVVVGALICLALVVRRRWPFPVLAFTTAGAAVAIVVTDGKTPYAAMAAVAAYTVA